MITKLRISQTKTKYIKGQWMDHITTGDTRIYLFGFIRIWRSSHSDQIKYEDETTPTDKNVGFKIGTMRNFQTRFK